MRKKLISDLLENKVKLNSSVTICGWVRTRRDSKAGVSFIVMNDGSCFDSLQVVAAKSLKNYQEDILHLTAGCSICVTGELVKSPAKGQSVEVHADTLTVVGWVEDPDTYPISPKHHTLEYLREHAHLRPRTNVIGAVTRVQNCAAQATHQFFNERKFYWIHTPIITASDCEGGGELFRVSTLDLMNLPRTESGQIDFSKDFFGREAFLTVSGQLNIEAYCLAMSRVYTFGPTFRAENSNTPRHLSEFWMIEPEIAFADLKETAKLSEDLLKAIFKAVLEKCSTDMTFFEKRIEKNCIKRLERIIQSPFVYITYQEAIAACEKNNDQFEFKVKWGSDLQTEHERYLSDKVAKGCPVVVMDYPKEIKAFYMRLNDDKKTVAAFDVLVPGMGEIVGGSQREERLAILDQRLDEMKLDKAVYNWYRDLRRYGTVPHGGFGIGFGRLLCYITGMPNIRDVVPYPRVPKHAEF